MAKMPKTIALPDKILLSTAKPGTSHTGTSYLIFFVPGNPGVIEYYRSFLTLLYKQVAELADNHQGRVRIDVLGASLNGFQCTPRHTNELKQLPIDMDGQVEFAEAALKAHCKTVLGLQGAASHEPVRVILIGHSMGGYLAMEMLRRHHSHVELGRRVQIDGVVGICPSLVHLARSEGGLKHSWLLTVPGLAALVALLVRLLTLICPAWLLRWLIEEATQYPEEAVNTTLEWLRSRFGFRETLHLLAEEFQRITEDPWDDTVWADSRTSLYFFYAHGDQWVPVRERDELHRVRKRHVRTTVEVDSTGVTHDFSIRHSQTVAKKVAGWVKGVMKTSEEGSQNSNVRL